MKPSLPSLFVQADRRYQLRPGLACLALVLGCAWCAHAAPSVEDTLFIPGTVPYDTKGNKVHHSALRC